MSSAPLRVPSTSASHAARERAATTTPDVSLSRRCTSPGSRAWKPTPAISGNRATSALASVPVSPPRSGAVGWPAGLSTTTTDGVSRMTTSGCAGSSCATAGASSDTSGSCTDTVWPGSTTSPFCARRRSTRTLPSSNSRRTAARPRPSVLATTLSRRAPRSFSSMTKLFSATCALSQSPGRRASGGLFESRPVATSGDTAYPAMPGFPLLAPARVTWARGRGAACGSRRWRAARTRPRRPARASAGR